uniref:Uncharacterized protein n=1 Tax=Anguilla anguilla TaxID=7936 RepID=A0A0E9X721_ANGAN
MKPYNRTLSTKGGTGSICLLYNAL